MHLDPTDLTTPETPLEATAPATGHSPGASPAPPQDVRRPASPLPPVPPVTAGPLAGFDPDAPYGRSPAGLPYSDRSKVVAGLLQIFCGSCGIGRFYLGDKKMGLTLVGITLGGLAMIFVPLILLPLVDPVLALTASMIGMITGMVVVAAAGIWGIVDGFLILSDRVPDAQGRPLRP